jgi:hypothetical protein
MSTILTKYNAIPRRTYINTATGKTSIWLEDVLEKNVVIDKSDKCLLRDPGAFRHTMFRGIHVLPPAKVLTNETVSLFTQPKTKTLPTNELIALLIDLFRQVIELEWEPGKFHLMLHSSGYDSRIVSELIYQIWQRRGDEWLGKVLFVCNKFEGPQFKAIMEHQGWDESQYMVVGAKVPISEYHRPSLDFETAWRKLNCIFGMPVNIFYYLIEAAQVSLRAPEDELVQTWCNYLMPIDYALKLDLLERYKFLYYHAMGGRNFKGESMEFPAAHPLLLAEAVRHNTPLKLNRVKREIVKRLDKKLHDLPETPVAQQGDWGRKITAELYQKAIRDYQASWYGQRVQMSPSWVVGFNRWWRRWSIASFCQHLIRSGYNLRMVK